jgi:putative FmdB family regulatory protein
VPIYEYQCRQCSQEFELLVLKATPLECPSCQSSDLEQLLSGFAVSSDGSRAASARTARQAAVTSNDHREKNLAHAEYVRKHAKE